METKDGLESLEPYRSPKSVTYFGGQTEVIQPVTSTIASEKPIAKKNVKINVYGKPSLSVSLDKLYSVH